MAEIGTFLMGGLETTAHSLSFTLYCIAAHPAVQHQIMQELIQCKVLEHCCQDPVRLKFEMLGQLSYLEAVLKETMRLYPAVAGFPR